ncbi:MAG: flagellar FliJ family protein [Nitrospiraceae bacterium]
MKVDVLRAYALQVEQVAKLELAELAEALRTAEEHVALQGRRADEAAERYLSQARSGSTVDELSGRLGDMDASVSAKAAAEQARAVMHGRWMTKRDEVLEASRYRKKLDILHERALRDLRRRIDQADQRLIDDRSWGRKAAR